MKVWKNKEAASAEEETDSLRNPSRLGKNTKLTSKRLAVEVKAWPEYKAW